MSLFRTLKALPIFYKSISNTFPILYNTAPTNLLRSLTTTNKLQDLTEFFDIKKNWGLEEVKSGRAWKVEELRLKSNSDLHKLWYVLLKERNMLLTMEEESKRQTKLFASPERIDKVEISMENVETVVKERNKAYHLLETGETGERPGEYKAGVFGLNYYYKKREYVIPKFMNVKWKKTHVFRCNKKDVNEFLLKYNEKKFLERRRARTRNFNHVIGLLKRFPNIDLEAIKEQYPDVDINKAKNSRKCRGHFVPK
ncbi:large ribosomal subunit protein uL29m [Onthophagus taurus]|uniref:large ribosomal subunit protein uL29m n=1 Tax=Onthophagus taurus TaxID=166361 RepID=UPI0039BE31DE